MNAPAHTPAPWKAESDGVRGPYGYLVAKVYTSIEDDGAHMAADIALIAAAPSMLAELRETADWLIDRAKQLRQLADLAPGVMRKRNEHLRQLRDEAARFDGRAALIRILITNATGDRP